MMNTKPCKVFLKRLRSARVEEKSPKKQDVYDFSMDSQSDDKDPTKDVVKKLIKEGKAKVAQASRKKSDKNVKKGGIQKKYKTARLVWKNVVKTLPVQNDHVRDTGIIAVPNKDHQDNIKSNVDNCPTNFVNNPKTAPIRRTKITDKKKLFEYVKSVTQSTPINKKASVQLQTGISLGQSTPINKKTSLQLPAGISPILPPKPWRVGVENIPRTFYFSRNKDDLPSFSSDYIPCSQPQPANNDASVNNLSNIENDPPKHENSQRNKVSQVILGRDGKRTPMRPLNVLQASPLARKNINLSLSKSFVQNARKKNGSGNTDDLGRKENSRNKEYSNSTTTDFFGFDDSGDDEDEVENQRTVLPNRRSLQESLNHLRSLVPKKKARANYAKTPNVLKSPLKQANIRTMLASNSKRGKVEDEIHLEESSNDSAIQNDVTATEDLHLFDDLEEPHTSFDTTMERKTYSRPRKRRNRHEFILLSTDDVSDEESQKKKPKRQQRKHNLELDKFVKEFNSMCEEVDQYNFVLDTEKA